MLKRKGQHERGKSRIITLLCLIAIGSGVAVQRDIISLTGLVPAYQLPWTPLVLDQPLGVVARWKLSRLSRQPEACRDFLLREAPSRVTALPDRAATNGCQLINHWRVAAVADDNGGNEIAAVRFNNAFIASCPLAVSWLFFERHGLQPTAQTFLGQRVTQVDHLGSYACRNIYGRENARRSEHATADALDVAGFRLAEGRQINLLADWANEDDAEGRFLRAIQQAACQSFGTVLGPDYNAAHRDHFHLGTRGWRVCR